MLVLKWLDEHFEEFILVILLILISTVMMAQVIARTIWSSMSWAEELARYAYVWTVFLSLGYTIKKGNALRVTVLMDLLPHKVHKTIEIVTNFIMLALYAVFFYYSITYTNKVRLSAQSSPAMEIPMWIMYLSTVIGFGLATIRMIQEIINNFKNFDKVSTTTLEETLKEAEEELRGSSFDTNAPIDSSDTIRGDV